MQQVGYHNANMIASKLRTTIDGQKAEMLAMLQEIATVPPAEETPAHDPPPIYTANAAVHQDIQL